MVTLIVFLFMNAAHAEPNCSGVKDKVDFMGIEFDFKEACFKHDACYAESIFMDYSKEFCDKRFRDQMKDSCRNNVACKAVAELYYKGVTSAKFTDEAWEKVRNSKSTQCKLKLIEADPELRAQIELRKTQQAEWDKMYGNCKSKENDRRRHTCMAKLKEFRVTNFPPEVGLGERNILGIGWAGGHRSRNARVLTERFHERNGKKKFHINEKGQLKNKDGKDVEDDSYESSCDRFRDQRDKNSTNIPIPNNGDAIQ